MGIWGLITVSMACSAAGGGCKAPCTVCEHVCYAWTYALQWRKERSFVGAILFARWYLLSCT